MSSGPRENVHQASIPQEMLFLGLPAVDAAAVALSYVLAAHLRFATPGRASAYVAAHGDIFLGAALTTLLALYLFRVYSDPRRFASLEGLLFLWEALAVAFFAQGFLFYLSGPLELVGRGVFARSLLAQAFLLSLIKVSSSLLLELYSARERTFLVGYDPAKEPCYALLRDRSRHSLEIVGVVWEPGARQPQPPFRTVGGYAELETLAASMQVRRLLLTAGDVGGESLQKFLMAAANKDCRISLLEDFCERAARKVPSTLLVRPELMDSCLKRHQSVSFQGKRVFDVLFSLALLLLLLPLGLVIALAIRLSTGGSPIFSQERAGRLGKSYPMYKFRTMKPSAEARSGPMLMKGQDGRATRLGQLLRRTHFDELPQLLNVLQGDMSVVGPRPERPFFIAELEKSIPLYGLRCLVRPGITGWAQVTQGYASSLKELEEKLAYDLYYLRHMSLRLDAEILIRTLPQVLLARGR